MITIYVPRSDTKTYVSYPVPTDLEQYYVVQVQSEPVLDMYTWYDPDLNKFVRSDLVQQYETEQYNAQQSLLRESAYKLECDPLTLESIVKRSMGLDTDADALLVQAVQRRIEIQTRYPYK